MTANLSSEAEFPLEPIFKGLPAHLAGILSSDLGRQGLKVLEQRVEFPIALLKSSALRHNQEWMKAFLARTGAVIAPHGKTTMSPELIAMQLRDGAWGITAATSGHVRAYHAQGVRRILHANQLVGAENIRGVLAMLAADPELDFYTLVDSEAGLNCLREGLMRKPVGRPLRVLLELGVERGRTGFRSIAQAQHLARIVAADPLFALSGVECFEGVFSGRKHEDDAGVHALLDQLAAFARRLQQERLFGIPEPLFTAGGSAYFDLVMRTAGERLQAAGFRIVLRSGCYLTHDSGHYRQIHERLGLGPLRAALEVWGCVQSRPETGLAIVNLGKRDISHDIDLPTPLWWSSADKPAATPLSSGYATKALNDQHLFLEVPEGTSLAVGDLVGFGVSHPCTTFDKWKALFIVDDEYRIETVVHTLF